MENSDAKIFLAVAAFTLVMPGSSATQLRPVKSGGQELQIKLQQDALYSTLEPLQQRFLPKRPSPTSPSQFDAAPSSVVLPFRELAQSRANNLGQDTLEGALVGFGFGSLMSSGNAQQVVNQEWHREEAVKQERARKKAEIRDSVTRGSANKVSGESGKGVTASEAGESRPPTRQASENW